MRQNWLKGKDCVLSIFHHVGNLYQRNLAIFDIHVDTIMPDTDFAELARRTSVPTASSSLK